MISLLPTTAALHINQSYHSLVKSQVVFVCVTYLKLEYMPL